MRVVQRGKVYQFGDRQRADQFASTGTVGELVTLPVLPETLLYFALSVGQQTVSLDELTSVLLRDPGATTQILRTAALEVELCDDGRRRIEDCVAALGVLGCFDALKDETSARDGLKPEIRKAWTHAQKIAENCAYIAGQCGIGIPLRDAYLVGLYHEIDKVPSLLDKTAESGHLSTALLVDSWLLPDCVRAYFAEQQTETQWAPLSELVRAAHALQSPKERTVSAQP